MKSTLIQLRIENSSLHKESDIKNDKIDQLNKQIEQNMNGFNEYEQALVKNKKTKEDL